MSVNEFDIAFIVDTTGSMGTYLAAAKQDLFSIFRKRGPTQVKRQIRIGLCTESFKKEDQQMLCDKVKVQDNRQPYQKTYLICFEENLVGL